MVNGQWLMVNGQATQRHNARPVALVAVVYIVMVMLYIVRVPMWTQPDEGSHLGYVSYLVRHRAFPIFEGNKKGQLYEAHQPPLYYLLCTPAYFLTGAHHIHEREIIVAYICRGVSALCGLGVVLFVGAVARSLFPSDRVMPLVAMGFAALLPMHLHVSASIGNDALAGLLSAATVAWMLNGKGFRFWVLGFGVRESTTQNPEPRTQNPYREAAIAGALAGLALLTKSSCLFLLPMVAVFYFMRGCAASDHSSPFAFRLSPFAFRLSPFAAACLTALLVVSPWWIRNTLLYGDPLAARAFLRGFDNPGPQYFLVERMNLSVFDYAVKLTLALTFMTFWGIFGEVNNAYKRYTAAVFGDDPHGERLTFYVFFVICLFFSIASKAGCIKEFRAASSRCALLIGLAAAAAFAGWFTALQATIRLSPFALHLLLFALSALLVLSAWLTSETSFRLHPSSLIPHPALLCGGIILILLQFLQFNTHYFQAQARYLHPMLIGIAPLFVWGLDSLLPKSTRRVWIPLLAVLLLALSVMNLTAWRVTVE